MVRLLLGFVLIVTGFFVAASGFLGGISGLLEGSEAFVINGIAIGIFLPGLWLVLDDVRRFFGKKVR